MQSVLTPAENGTIEEARYAVSMIVGRDTQSLTEEGVTKAAVGDSCGKLFRSNHCPMLYMAIGGIPLMFLYKGINTMDSMLGYKNDKYLYFGRCAAKLDDVANYIPARTSGWLMALSTVFVGMDTKNAVKIYRRDRRNHASPNSAQTEAAMAGALDVQLAGNAYYFGKLYEKPTIGDPIRPSGNRGYFPLEPTALRNLYCRRNPSSGACACWYGCMLEYKARISIYKYVDKQQVCCLTE